MVNDTMMNDDDDDDDDTTDIEMSNEEAIISSSSTVMPNTCSRDTTKNCNDSNSNNDNSNTAATKATTTTTTTKGHDVIDEIISTYLPNFTNSIPQSHIQIGVSNIVHSFQKEFRTLLYHQQVPNYGWSDFTIQTFLTTLSSLDTNNKVPIIIQQQQSSAAAAAASSSSYHQRWVGVGEREGKVYSNLVMSRQYGFAHGMGRSGQLMESQPKAVGSTILAQLTNQLLYDIIVRGGSHITIPPPPTSPLAKSTTSTRSTATSTTAASATASTTTKSSSKQTHQQKHHQSQSHSIIVPMCTGMSIALVLQSLRQSHLQQQQRNDQPSSPQQQTQSSSSSPPPPQNKDIVLWSRIDQKSCYKAILAAGLQCVIVPTKRCTNNNNNNSDKNENDDSVVTDIDALQAAIDLYTPARILAIVTTTSCFAPRVPDQVDIVAKLIQQYNDNNHFTHNSGIINTNDTTTSTTNTTKNQYHMYHIINHAYGLQCSKTGKLLSRAMTIGHVDAIVCSLDKNFLVPVSGSIVLAPDPRTIRQLSQLYAGRASISHIIDTAMTILSMGLMGYQQLHQTRQQSILPKFIQQFQTIAIKYNERLLSCPTNTISFAMTLDTLVRPRRRKNSDDDAEEEDETDYLKSIERELTQLGAMLFHRCISGTRVVARNIHQTIHGGGTTDNAVVLVGFGSSTEQYPHAYITAACTIGLYEPEMDEFFLRFDKTLHEFQKKQRKKWNV